MSTFDYNELAGIDDDELGIFPLIPLISAGASLVGGLLGGGKKKGGAAPSGGTEAALAMGPMMEAIAGKIVSSDEIKGIVRELLSTVPSPVKEQVRDVIRSIQAEGGNTRQAQAALVGSIESKFMPTINSAMALLKHARLQREATSEHRGKSNEAKRWRDSRRAQQEIVKRIVNLADRQAAMQSVIDQKLGSSTVLPKSKVSYLGGKRLVDLLARK